MTKGEKCRAAREAVENLRKALKVVSEDAGSTPMFRDTIVKQLYRAQAKLAELTGSTEP